MAGPHHPQRNLETRSQGSAKPHCNLGYGRQRHHRHKSRELRQRRPSRWNPRAACTTISCNCRDGGYLPAEILQARNQHFTRG
jgi:hypothetical protein